MVRGFVVLLLALLVALSVLLSKAGALYTHRDSLDGVSWPEIDAVVCLAGAKGRIATAADVWTHYYSKRKEERRPPPVLYISGMGSTGWDDFLKNVRTGVAHVITPPFVILEKESENTVQNVQWVTRIATERKWKRIILVTSSYHMKRSLMMFDRLQTQRKTGLEIESYSVVSESFDAQDWKFSLQGLRVTLIEYLKYLYYLRIWDPSYQPI